MKRSELFLLAFSLCLPALAEAGPAPWYRWRSDTGDVVCAQTSPGVTWVRQEDRVYVDPRCLREDKSAAEKTREKTNK